MKDNLNFLKDKARQVRGKVLEMTAAAGKGHLGGAFSCTEILVALYYGGILRLDASRPRWEGRDRFLLSKGHACEALYVILADLGFFPGGELENYNKPGCLLGGHPNRSIAGIEADTGSLGHGLGIGAGLALAAKMDQKDFKTVVLLSDGECCEGSVWEAAMFAAKHKLNNLIGIVDKNGLCVTDIIEDCVALDPLDKKWIACGWEVVEMDGHSFDDLLTAFERVPSDRPRMIIADTVKGKGVSFMEGNIAWHHGVPKGELLQQARKELEII
ncbi:MAG TPA: transketolase [Candidatus Omnitrophica bacterium]|nr:MAG: hypothetical protein A2Z81_00925 [Omnitrophica WOR_2 bacterium GWA2_45_18]HBR14566.1 transketolase [Candidatus Omnitrophota bacterium]